MRELNRKSKTQISQPISIPPLQLPEIRVQDSPIRYRPAKEPPTFLKMTSIDHNTDFLKQKSLYRYTISRKLSRKSFNKSQTQLIQNQTLKHHKSQLNMEIDLNKTAQIQNKERSVISQNSKATAPKQKHFRRKTRHETCSISFPQSLSKVVKENSSVIKQQREEVEGDLNIYKKALSDCKREVSGLKSENRQLKREIDILKQRQIRCDCSKETEEKNTRIKILNEQNRRLIRQLKKINPIHSDKFINQNKLQNELLKRGIFIKQLQQKIKYIELENITLRKVKKEKDQQATLIQKLEIRNRELQNRVKIMTSLRTKRNRLKGSMMSSCSEISLNLSADADDQDYGKFYEALKSTQRTFERGGENHQSQKHLQRQMDETKLYQWWTPKNRA